MKQLFKGMQHYETEMDDDGINNVGEHGNGQHSTHSGDCLLCDEGGNDPHGHHLSRE
jgi:hypothetical protein